MIRVQKRFQQPDEWQWDTMVNADHARLRFGAFARHTSPRGNIILAPGLAEFSEKYFEHARILSRLGYNIYALNWRGQGGSEPYLPDRFRRHSMGFDRDVRDLLQFMDDVVPHDAPRAFLAHSTGGLITFLTLQQVPDIVDAAVISAPLLGFGDARARGRERLFAYLPLPSQIREAYSRGNGWIKRADPLSIAKPQAFSSDPVRMNLHDHWMEAKDCLRVGAPTIGFVQAASRAMLSLRRRGVAESITTPVHILSAGKDHVVRAEPIFNLAARLPRGAHTHFPDARHEIMHETSAIRRQAMKIAHGFIAAHLR